MQGLSMTDVLLPSGMFADLTDGKVGFDEGAGGHDVSLFYSEVTLKMITSEFM